MGNNTSSVSPQFTSVHDIPPGTAPPSIGELTKKVKDVALYATQHFDPVDLKVCQQCLKTMPDATRFKTAETIVNDLAFYTPDQKPFSEKTYQFKLEGHPELWISSTKNSDHTLSYWFQYPILPFHIRAAILSAMNIPITPDNLSLIAERYPALCKQLAQLTKHEVAKCEQIEPLYVDLAIKALLSRGYHHQKKHIEIE